MRKKNVQATQRGSTQTLSFVCQDKDTKKISCKQSKNKKFYKKPDSVKHLEEMYLAFQKKKYPGIPDKVLVTQSYRDDTANALTKCIIDYIRFTGGQAERINTTGRPIDRRITYTDVIGRRCVAGSIEWIPGTSTNGSADISATISGKSVKIEVKIGRDRLSEAQKQYQRDIEAAGGMYFIAKNLSEFIVWYASNYEGVTK